MSLYHPEYYDLFHDDHGEDVIFYRALAQESGGPVLELGAGTGRVVLPIARAGLPIWALDNSAPMLEVLRRRVREEPPGVRALVTPVLGNMASFSLRERFRMIQIPYRAFLHNRFREEQLSCLSCCMEHLLPGGILAFNVFHPSLVEMSMSVGSGAGRWRWVDEQPSADGGWVLLSEAVLYDTVEQLVTTRFRYERYDEAGRLVRSDIERLSLAYLYPGDLRELLSAAGFVDVHIDGGFDRRPFVADGQELVIRARRP